MLRAHRSLLAFCLFVGVCLALQGCATKEAARHATYRPVSFAQLPGWDADDQAAALSAFQRSCTKLLAVPSTKANGSYGKAGDWAPACARAKATPPGGARAFFEANFQPMQVRAGRAREGLFTGYYEPELNGNRQKTGAYRVPLLARPSDLVSVDLGLFRPTLKGQRVAGRVADGGKLVPYADRQEINGETAELPTPLRQPLVYVEDPVDAFFLEIQGSGRIRFADGSTVRLNYDGQNGHPYTPIGRVLLARGALEKGRTGMAEIRAWLAAHPEEAERVMEENKSYVFFREAPVGDPGLGPPGAQGVPLTPGRSLAVDLSSHGLGAPVFVAAEPPNPDAPPFQRLMVAQDTGGAIVGPVRGDVFWGFGPDAARLAGGMKSKGEMFVLVPPPLVTALSASGR